MSITITIVTATCLVSLLAFSNDEIMNKFIFYPFRIQRQNSFFEFISSGFLHANYMHLFFNMFSLYSIGSFIEETFEGYFAPYGNALYLILYFGGMAAASLPDYVKHKNNYNYRALGASGAVSAVIFAFVFFKPWAYITFFFIPMPAIVFGVAYLLFSTYMGIQGKDNIGHSAHFWGGVVGFIFTAACAQVLAPELVSEFINSLRS